MPQLPRCCLRVAAREPRAHVDACCYSHVGGGTGADYHDKPRRPRAAHQTD